ncbi:membrane protein [Agaricicola taiwanensis]|uniref:Membrane protein n=1 Tax=Agaricicola taiwanensis TaxID=591372 RepID=A0A8J3DY22_9RHOB|nr:exopolysaccharide biosynthesis protein [Agaricicola taiwanensis]GGE52628.1 membrane protein [Agaricicola taiwanensis]
MRVLHDGNAVAGRTGRIDAPDRTLSGLICDMCDLGHDGTPVSVTDIREKIGERSFGPFLLIPALIEISPIGGIPGLPTVLAVIISLFAVQILMGRKHLWLPDFLEHRSIDGKKFARGMARIRKTTRWVDHVLQPRLKWATRPPWVYGAAAMCLALCATVPVLELVPFASSFPMAAIALFGLGLVARDGIVMLLGFVVSSGAFWALYGLLTVVEEAAT